jgi:PAS domain S-box-containing protein
MIEDAVLPVHPPAVPPAAADEPGRERLRRAHEAAGLGAWDWEVEADRLHWDDGARALHGLDAVTQVSRDVLMSRIHPADREQVLAAVAASLDPAVCGPCEVRYRLAGEGEGERWIAASGRVEWAGEGAGARAVRVLGVMRDDTRARADERALAERDERLRAALYASRTGTFRWDIRTGALDWDENLDRLFGLVPGQTVRSLEGFVATVHPGDRARVIAACERCAAEGADFDEEFRVVWPDGSEHWLDDKGRTFLDADGRPAYMTGACVDITERKRAAAERERLLQAERAANALAQQRLAELEAMYACAPVGMAVLDRDLRYARVNEQLAALHGTPAAAHVGRTPMEMVPFEARELEELLRSVLETGRPVAPFPVRATLPGSDEERTWLATYYPIAAPGGGVAAVGAIVDEVTALERTAGALRRSEGRLRRILESGIVGTFFWNVDGAVTDANDAFLELLGYTRADLAAGRIDWRQLTPPAWKEEDERKVAELLATGRHGPYEKEYLAADGGAVPVMIASAFFDGSTTEGVALCLDRTAQRRAEAALRQRERELRDALAETQGARAAAEETAHRLHRQHSATVALSAALSDEEIARALISDTLPMLDAQAAAVLRFDGAELLCAGYTGYDPEEMRDWMRYPAALGTPAGDVALTGEPVFIDDAAAWARMYPRWADWVGAHGYEGYAGLPMRAGGRVAGVLVLNFTRPRTFSTRDREGLLGLAAVAAQALERARLYREAQEARAEAETANQAKSAFLASMSHELRTPLNAISGYADLMEAGIRGPTTDAQLQDLARIRRSTRHLLGLINDVLSFARIDAGSLSYDIAEVPLAPLLADAEAMVAPQSAERGLALTVRPCNPGARVRADADKVRQILLNLLGNAIKFTPRGGAVEAFAEVEDGAARIHVRDTGVGIPAEKLSAVFEPFVQLERRYSSPGEGVGLGLAISRELARAMGGELSVESAVGEGSTFTLVLPAVAGPPAAEPSPPVPAAAVP